MIPEAIRTFHSVYATWFGKSVVLLVVLRQCHIPLPCSIVRESLSGVRIRIKAGWELDFRKDLILAIEEDIAGQDSRIN